MNYITIARIPHNEQRYDTLGDYQQSADENLVYHISKELGEDYGFLVAIHELIESYLCKRRGISWDAIDAFDREYEDRRVAGILEDQCGTAITDDSEPGDSWAAPYYKEHQFASAIERLLCNELGLDWHQYEAGCIELLREVDHPDRHKMES